jgi:Protein of unknown function (DUF2442)
MLHEIHTIKSFRKIAPYTLEIVFGNNDCKTINFLPLLNGEMYGPLKNKEYFDKVMIDPEVKTIVWPNGADFDPALLYNWENCIEELKSRVKEWEAETT